jgi:hypothetical protein
MEKTSVNMIPDNRQTLARVMGTIAATLLGIAFFFAIIGVFGLPIAIAALVLFVISAMAIFRRPQEKRL